MCWKCGNNIETNTPITRFSECPVCKTDLHSCKNCKFYSIGAHYDCHETIDELVKDKEKANFCDNFSVKQSFSSSTLEKSANAKKQALDAFNSLFGSIVCL